MKIKISGTIVLSKIKMLINAGLKCKIGMRFIGESPCTCAYTARPV